jgi:threonine/homoserine/homoserine lactone efflux protein
VALRAGGVAYMAWLGLQSLRRAFSARLPTAAPIGSAGVQSLRKSLVEGFATNALNPAIAAFYLVLLPQFIPRGAPIIPSALLLTAIHVALAASWHLTWAAAGGGLARTLSSPRARQALETVTGIALIGLAIRMGSRG